MDKKERRATTKPGIPPKQGLYDPANEHDACGIGFIVDIKGRRSHSIVHQALEILVNLEHRGACGCEPNTGDGAGILMQVPHGFFREACTELGFQLPAPGQYGVGMVYLPPDPEDRRECEEHFESIVREEGQQILGWRDVPTDNQLLGETALSCEPFIRQIFIGRNPEIEDDQAFERKLYVIRRRGYYDIAASDIGTCQWSGVEIITASISSRAITSRKSPVRKHPLKPFP